MIVSFIAGVLLTPAFADESEEPKGPTAKSQVQKILEEAELLRGEKDANAALAAADRALALARSNDDAAGEAFAHRERAKALEVLGRTHDALTAWQEAASSWATQGAGPEEIAALCARLVLFASARDSVSMTRDLERVVAIANGEKSRPRATVDQLNDASNRMWRIGQLSAAEKLARTALSISQERTIHPLAAASSFNNLGVVASKKGDLGTAKSHFERALDIREKHAPGSVAVAGSLNNLGNVASHQGDLTGARDYYQRALEIKEQHDPGSRDVALTLNNLGLVASYQGDLEGALDYFGRALVIDEKQAPGSLGVARSLNNLGLLATNHGDLDAARDYYQRALEIKEQRAPGSLDVAGSLHNLGAVAFSQGDLEAALDYYRRALAIRGEHAPESLAVAETLNNLALVAGAQGDLDAAHDYHCRVLEITEKRAPGSIRDAGSLHNLGVLAQKRNDLDAARGYYRRALEINEREAPGSLAVAGSLNNLGVVASNQGDFESALDYLRRSLEIEAKLAPGSTGVAKSLANLGAVAGKQGDLETARDCYRRALAVQELRAPGSIEVASILYNLGILARERGDLEAARDNCARAWEVVREQAHAVSGDEARLAFAELYVMHAAELIRAEIALGNSERALAVLEESRAQGLLELLERRGLEHSASRELWSAYKEAERRRDQLGENLADAASRLVLRERDLADLEAQGMTGDELADALRQLTEARSSRDEALTEYTRARVEMQTRLAEVRRSVPGLEPEAFSLESAREVLSRGTVFIAFSVGNEATVAVVVPSDPEAAVEGYVVELTAEQLTKRVDFVRDRLGVGRLERGLALAEKKRLEDASRSLFRKLFSEEVRTVLDAAERVVISPDGPLWDLSFAALDVGGDGEGARWLGLEKSLSYGPSLTTLVHAKRREVASDGESILIVGDPMPRGADEKESNEGEDGEAPADNESPSSLAANPKTGERTRLFPDGIPPDPLPGAREEAMRLGKLYETEPLIGPDATETVVRERIRRATVVHLATHGYFHPTQPMSSGVLLAPPKDRTATGTDADGALQAWEILSSLDLHADLIVLSACETGLGRAVRGEGLVGLTRALQAAGANSVVATHWKVADDSTTELMVTFHEKLRAGARKDDALREAMREVAGRKETSHPYFWAAFFLSGGSE